LWEKECSSARKGGGKRGGITHPRGGGVLAKRKKNADEFLAGERFSRKEMEEQRVKKPMGKKEKAKKERRRHGWRETSKRPTPILTVIKERRLFPEPGEK